MKNALTIARAFLTLTRSEVGDSISNLKLQKLLYYAQGFHLALYGTPLFKEDIIRWNYGPVVVEVYEKYSKHGSDAIPVPTEEIKLLKKEMDLIENVWKVYGQFSAWRLSDMTHNEDPWKTTSNLQIISHKKLRDFFKTLIVK
jgi:uncharacterized phage-associated protein